VINVASTTTNTITDGQAGSQTNCTTNINTQVTTTISTPTIVGNDCSSVIGGNREVQVNDFTYIPTTEPITPWSANNITCPVRSINFTSIKGSSTFANTIVYVTSDGTRMYLPSFSDKTIKQYSLSIPNDITSTITYVGVSPVLPFFNTTLQISSDGTKIFILYESEKFIGEYNLLTPWDITSMSTTLVNSLTYPINTNVAPFVFNRNGTKIYSTYRQPSNANTSVVWNLSTPYDLSSAGSPTISNIQVTQSVIRGTMYFEDDNNNYISIISSNPLLAVFDDGMTNNDLNSTSNNCLFQLPSCTDDVHIYDATRTGSTAPFSWTLTQSLTGL
jgi:hypothetical protein